MHGGDGFPMTTAETEAQAEVWAVLLFSNDRDH